jgi:Protein of unknown function (DUF3106)
MKRTADRRFLRERRRAGAWAAGLITGIAGLTMFSLSSAQQPASATNPPTGKVIRAEQGARWSELKPAQQSALKPLERDWADMEPRSKQKWLELTDKFSQLTPVEQSRVQERMAEWGKLTPRERGEARAHFQNAKQLPLQDRQARWKEYEALSPEQKQRFAARAKPPVTPRADEKAGRGAGADAKSNIVPNPNFAATPKPVTPTIVQARPGATTTLITKRPTPPGHQQTGMPKIAATPEFVDKATLLPQRGPQGAAAARRTANSDIEPQLPRP